MPKSIRHPLVVSTTITAVMEWLLFEITRIPYRPPHDMLTFLGTAKYAVHLMIGLIAVGWLLLVTYLCLGGRSKRRDRIAFAIALGTAVVVVGLLVRYPLWPVTPFNLLFSQTGPTVPDGGWVAG